MAHNNHTNYRAPGDNIDVSQFLLREADFLNVIPHNMTAHHTTIKKDILVKNIQASQQLYHHPQQQQLPTHSGIYNKIPIPGYENLIKPDDLEVKHENEEEEIGTGYVCEICNKSFKRKNYLQQHTRTHSGDRPFKCDVCQKSFLENHQLRKHAKTHTGERPHECPICQKAFQEKHQLTKHSRTHTEERPFSCDICRKAFKEKHQLKKHTRTHTEDRPYKCEICQKAFKEKHQLRKHTRTHNNDRPFKCEICHKTFKEKHQLSIHSKTHVRLLDSASFSRQTTQPIVNVVEDRSTTHSFNACLKF